MSVVPTVIYGFILLLMALYIDDHTARLKAIESEDTVTIVVPDDLRKLPCVPMQYLLSNRRIAKIHSYSKNLKICKAR